jgi:aryl-alcohol dehydrogenase-like predicted oxidoreductase
MNDAAPVTSTRRGPDDTFAHRRVRAFDKRVCRLGLAMNYGMTADDIRTSLDSGIDFLYYSMRTSKSVEPLREAIQRDRERVVIAAMPTTAWCAGSVRRSVDRALKRLGTDYLDAFMLGWLGVGAAFSNAVVDELGELRASGKVRAVGVSIHDRERAGKLALDSILDVLMIRYNAAHPGAEKDIFPHLEKRRPAVVAYTATSWRKLLKAPRGWDGPVPTAGDCYRFCLSNPHVDIVLTGPADRAQFESNLAALAKGPLSDDEQRWMREFGRVVHG